MKGRTFVPGLQVARDATLDGAPVLVLGWWIDPAGAAPVAEVLALATQRQTRHLFGQHGEPVLPPPSNVG